ncbi:hypothetical protein CCR94_08150 [Rhodoblastus sphagnicola]|uniref:YbjN domain-containing protein n=1 Tax=Rhodoblastus sphagnicola TaxID=333368 RepID=A0A2S6NAV7_9HYPH|nr:YbjN domain-containing protein [Rhodoblastus sphagnicola]MBB4198987.1 hypothetical protein [Rhodoblastus sphagnicola]PPQ31745.1 hypothetical protein CCR94_08150 [Rhodoblastus sphagnicola]
MSETVIAKLTLESLRDTLQTLGYRVETMTDPVANVTCLRSATNGCGFEIRPGNPIPGGDEFVDAALVAVLQVQGDLPLGIVNQWNVSRRFARLQLSSPFLALTQDISVVGGVTPSHLRSQIEIWDRLIQELIVYLRTELSKLVSNQAAPSIEQANGHQAANAPVAPTGAPGAEARA